MVDVALVHRAIAIDLFADNLMSLSDAAKLARKPTGVMLTHLASLGVLVADCDAKEFSTIASAELRETALYWKQRGVGRHPLLRLPAQSRQPCSYEAGANSDCLLTSCPNT